VCAQSESCKDVSRHQQWSWWWW